MQNALQMLIRNLNDNEPGRGGGKAPKKGADSRWVTKGAARQTILK